MYGQFIDSDLYQLCGRGRDCHRLAVHLADHSGGIDKRWRGIGLFYCLRDQLYRELPDEVSLCVFIATKAPQNGSPLSDNFEHWLGAEYAADVYRRGRLWLALSGVANHRDWHCVGVELHR